MLFNFEEFFKLSNKVMGEIKMSIYFINILLLIFWAIILFWKGTSKLKKAIFITIATFQWILISGLRHISIGADTLNYYNIFNSIKDISWTELFDNLYKINFSKAEGRDPGYDIFEKTVQIFTHDYQMFLIIIAVIFTFSIGYFIYKNSSEPFFSFLIYSCLFYAFFALTGHRQTLATALVVFIGYELIKKRKLIPFILIVLVASTIHKSAILFFPFYFLSNIKLTKKYLISLLTVGILLLLMGNSLYAPLANFLGYENYLDTYIGGTETFTFMMVIITLISLWRRKKMIQNNKQSIHFLNAVIIATLLSILTLDNQSFMRIQQYYSLFIMLIIPEIINTFEKKEKIFIYYGSAVLLILLFARNNPQYMFFWQ